MTRRRWIAAVVCLACCVHPLAAQRAKLLIPLDSLVSRAQRDSMDAPAHYELALGYWVGRKFDLADQELRRAIAIEPHTAEAYLALSYLPYGGVATCGMRRRGAKCPAIGSQSSKRPGAFAGRRS
jgi:Tfp pilus assembly protein PilF